MSDRELLDMLIHFFDARVIGSWSPAEWALVLEKIKRTPMRYGLGQWV